MKINQTERDTLNQWIGANRCLYNVALTQRKMIDHHEVKARGDSPINYHYQSKELKELKGEFPWFKDVPSQSLQQTLMNLDNAFKRFWKGVSDYPQYKKKCQDTGIKIPKGSGEKGNFYFPKHENPKMGYLKLPKLKKPLRFYKHRDMEGVASSLTIRKEGSEFYVSILCEVGDKYKNVKHQNSNILGIDRGISKSIACSNGEFFDLPKSKIKLLESKIAKIQVILARKIKRSKSWLRLKSRVNKLHKRISRIRHDFLWKTAYNLSKSHAVIGLEDLKIKNMSKSSKGSLEEPGKNVSAKSGLNRSILREGWYMFSQMLEWECFKHGGEVVYINPRNTSITCSSCNKVDKASRKSQALFECECGFTSNADFNASLNIRDAAARAVKSHAIAI